MESAKISRALMQRLPGYLNYLKSLPGEDHNISATTIASALGLGEVQVRKDLAKISEEGRRRTGRSRDQLIRDITHYLDFRSTTTTIIVGAGALGQALLDDSGFDDSGLNVMACFDLHSTMKKTAGGKPIYPMRRLESFCKHYDVRIGILAVPPESAQLACDGLVACGIQGIWNLTSVQLKVPEGIAVRSEHPKASLSAQGMQL